MVEVIISYRRTVILWKQIVSEATERSATVTAVSDPWLLKVSPVARLVDPLDNHKPALTKCAIRRGIGLYRMNVSSSIRQWSLKRSPTLPCSAWCNCVFPGGRTSTFSLPCCAVYLLKTSLRTAWDWPRVLHILMAVLLYLFAYLFIRSILHSPCIQFFFDLPTCRRRGLLWYLMALSDTHVNTLKTPLDQGSASRRDLYLSETQHSQETNIHAPSGIRTRNPNKREAAEPRLRSRCHWFVCVW